MLYSSRNMKAVNCEKMIRLRSEKKKGFGTLKRMMMYKETVVYNLFMVENERTYVKESVLTGPGPEFTLW